MKLNKALSNLIQYEFYPLGLFKNCLEDSLSEQYKSYYYNKEHVKLLEIPILNWILSSLILYLSLYYIETSCVILYKNIVLALIGMLMSISIIISTVFMIMFSYLSYVEFETIKK